MKQKNKKLHKTDMEQGHWVLAKLGKRVLRPGGLELTRLMLDEMDINKGLNRTGRKNLSKPNGGILLSGGSCQQETRLRNDSAR